MPANAIRIPTALMLEFCAGHALAMQCGVRASQFLDRAAGGWDERANLEALRMAGLTARLMDGVQRLVPRVRGTAAAQSSALVSHSADGVLAVRPASAAKHHAAPGQRRGCLKNGNPSGDYLQAPRCGARTRAGCPCRQPGMTNGRCRMHGGLSTGPRTPEGSARSRAARLTHGYRTGELIGLRHRAVHAARRLRSLNRALSAGHGVDRSQIRNQTSEARTRGRNAAPLLHSDFWFLTPSSSAGHGVGRSEVRSQTSEARTQHRNAVPVLHSDFWFLASGSAGHGLHRSFRDHLRSSAAGTA